MANKVITAFEQTGEIFIITQLDDLFAWDSVTVRTWDEYHGKHETPTIETASTFIFDEENETLMDSTGCGGFDTYEDALDDMNEYIKGGK